MLGSAHVSGMCGACEAHSLSQASGSPRGRAHHTIRSSASDSNILTLSFSSRRGEEVIAHLDKVCGTRLRQSFGANQRQLLERQSNTKCNHHVPRHMPAPKW